MISPSGNFRNFKIPYKKVLTRLGYAEGRTGFSEDIKMSIEAEIDLAYKLLDIRRVMANSIVSITTHDTVKLQPNLAIKSRDIADLLSGCDLAFGFAVTIGQNLETKIRDYTQRKETAKAVILDAVGSAAVEEIAEITNNEIALSNGNRPLTRRFSPGYGDWHISGQKDLLKWLGAEKIGITLTDSFQMLPEKTISAIMGVKKQ